jgi:tRNA nucleotidyltransferase (CCA-adding enzyme)
MRLPTDNFQLSQFSPEAVENRLDGSNRFLFNALRRLVTSQSIRVYLVGGPVRDLLLNSPLKDLDFVVVGKAPEVAGWLAEQSGGRVITHPRFGTATVILDEARVDLVTARREVYPRPGSLPQVFPGSIDQDLARRDFSVNALAWQLTEDSSVILDRHCGLEDLRRGLIRTLHSKSFTDDPTRLLRAVRYEQRLAFQLEEDTADQLQTAVAQAATDTVSGDRLRHELARILEEERPGDILRRASDLGILTAIHPALGGAEYLSRWSALVARVRERQAEASVKNATGIGSETELEREPLPIELLPVEPLTWLAALAYPRSAGDGEGLIRRLNMPRPWAQVVRDTIKLRDLETEIAFDKPAPSRLCHILDGMAPEAVSVVAGLTELPTVSRSLRRYWVEYRQITPALKGRDLLAMGVAAGPAVGNLLAELRTARLDGMATTEAEERRWVQKQLKADIG